MLGFCIHHSVHDSHYRDNGSEASTRPAEECGCGDVRPDVTNNNGKPVANHCSWVEKYRNPSMHSREWCTGTCRSIKWSCYWGPSLPHRLYYPTDSNQKPAQIESFTFLHFFLPLYLKYFFYWSLNIVNCKCTFWTI